jgi:hypothetical protein
MFTINIYLRFALIALGFLAGVGLWMAFGFWYGFPFLLTGIVLLLGYIFLGTIISTNMLIGEQRIDEAEQRLKLTFFPKLILPGYKGVYFMTHGAIAAQRKDMGESERYLRKALEVGLPSDNERAAAKLQLLALTANKTTKAALQHQFNEIKELNITEPMIREQVKEIEKQIKMAQGNPMNPSTMAMMQGRNGFRQAGGGKRTRPRVR